MSTLLAQIIAGEALAGSNNDSFGVASTIYNRSTSPAFANYGSTPLAQATAPSQFSAYPNALGTPTTYQQNLADSLENGTFTSQGNPGTATYYNGPGGSSYNAYASNPAATYGPGSNAYSDVYRWPASSSFVLPQAGGTPNTTSSPDTPGGDAFDPDSGMFDSGSALSPGLSGSGTVGYNATVGAGSGLSAPNAPGLMPESISVNPNTAADPNLTPGASNPITPNAPANSGASAGTAPSGTSSGSGGNPVDVTADPDAITAANTEAKAVGGLTSGIGSDTSSLETAGTGWLNAIFGDVQNTGIRAAFVLAGLVVMLGAFLFFYIDSKQGEKIVHNL